MNEFITVYSAEVMRRLRSRAFIFGLVIGALGIIVLIRLPHFIDSVAQQSYRVVLAGDADLITAAKPLLKDDYNVAASAPGLTQPRAADLDSHKASLVIVLTHAQRGIRATVYAKDPAP